MILFFDPMNTYHKETLAYAQVIYNKYNSKGFEIIGISNNDKNATEELFDYGGFSFPFIYDTENKIHNKLKMNDCCGGTILINREKDITFQNSVLLSIENLRQLVEKEVLGQIAYDFQINSLNRDRIFQNQIRNIPFLDVRSHSIKYVDEFESNLLVITFLSSVCPHCNSASRINTLKQLKERTLGTKGVGFILVFFKPFNEKDILGWENQIEMPFDKYISQDDIFTEDEKYITDPSLKTDPMTIVLNMKKEILFIEQIGMNELDVNKKIAEIILEKTHFNIRTSRFENQ